MIRVLCLSGSPVPGSSTEILLQRIASSVTANLPGPARCTLIRLNDLDFVPCQACGEAPTPRFCFFDDLDSVYRELARCDCLLVGSPIYFDAVSSQLKRFIDRCNCLRPADFDNTDPDHDFIKLLHRKRPGAMVLVGGENGWFEGARRCIAGFFKWVEVVNEGYLRFVSKDFRVAGEAAADTAVLAEADELGRKLAGLVRGAHD